MTRSQPSITGTTHTLPFDKLSPRDFERLCLWLVEREGYERSEHLGAAGSEQGRDIVAWREGRLWAFQCKRVQRFGPKDALAEVEKVLALPEDQHPVGLVFLVTCDVSANTRRQVRERCAGEMEGHFWAGTELDEKVKHNPDIVEEFFRAGHGGTTMIGDGSVQTGGIRAGRIKAENVVHGVQLQDDALAEVAGLVELAGAIQRGGIEAEEIEASNVVAGLQFIAGTPPDTSDDTGG